MPPASYGQGTLTKARIYTRRADPRLRVTAVVPLRPGGAVDYLVEAEPARLAITG
jgi:hypothetical protein